MNPSEPVAPDRIVRVGHREVGEGRPVLIIAEAGVNHDGSVQKALQLVDVAADAGADLVKFQMFQAADLATTHAPTAAYQKPAAGDSQRQMLRKLELSETDFERIAAHCHQRSIGFLATPFGITDVDRLVRLGVPAIKIASSDLNNPLLLRRAADTRLPLILSTGASTGDEIAATVRRLRSWNADQRLILLHCVSGYPTPLEAANLRAIAALRRTYHLPCGFSDHTQATEIAGWAVAAGACVLEKHFTLDRAARGPDHAMSLDPHQLKAYIATARAAERALGTGQLGFQPVEAETRRLARRSVVAAQFIPAGAILTRQLLTVKRPGGGIPPDQLDALVGRRAATDIYPDTVLAWEHVR